MVKGQRGYGAREDGGEDGRWSHAETLKMDWIGALDWSVVMSRTRDASFHRARSGQVAAIMPWVDDDNSTILLSRSRRLEHTYVMAQ